MASPRLEDVMEGLGAMADGRQPLAPEYAEAHRQWRQLMAQFAAVLHNLRELERPRGA